MNNTDNDSPLNRTRTNVERAMITYLEARGLAVKDADGSPRKTIQDYPSTTDPRINDAIRMWNQLVEQFRQAESEFNASMPNAAELILSSLESFENGVALPISDFLEREKDSPAAKRIAETREISFDDIRDALEQVNETRALFSQQVRDILSMCRPFAPAFKHYGITERKKEPLLSCFEWRLKQRGWEFEEIAQFSGAFDNARPTKKERREAMKALKKRITRWAAYLKPILERAVGGGRATVPRAPV
jgi:hypothetical protein